MKNKKNIGLISGAIVVILIIVLWPQIQKLTSGGSTNYPTRDISLTVPFNAGGSTDLTGRALAEPMGRMLGVNVTVANTPGAGGSVGANAVYTAPKDGYNILTDGMLAFTSMPILDTMKTTYKEWDIWLATFTPNVIVVKGDSPYKTLDDLIEVLKAKPNEITAGTAGPGSAGHIAAELFAKTAQIQYKHVPYQGGNPAIVATLSGEVEFAPQLLVEMEDMIKAGELRALAVFEEEDHVIDGGITIPSILNYLPELKKSLPMGETTGIAVPKGLDEDVLKKIDDAFENSLTDESFVNFCNTKGFTITGMNRVDSSKYVEKLSSIVGWTLYDAGVGKISPEEYDIPRP